MTIQLKPEQEQVVGQAIQAGLVANADEIFDMGIDAIRQRLKSPSNDANMPVLSRPAFSSSSAACANRLCVTTTRQISLPWRSKSSTRRRGSMRFVRSEERRVGQERRS